MACSPSGSSVHGILPDKNTGVGCHFLLQGIFPTQGWNLGLLYCSRLYGLSHQGSPFAFVILLLKLSAFHVRPTFPSHGGLLYVSWLVFRNRHHSILCVDHWDVMEAELGTVMDTKPPPQVNCTEAKGTLPAPAQFI